MSVGSTVPESLPPPASPASCQWRAQWIGKRTDPAHRIVQSLTSDQVAWVEPGHWLGQTFTAPGRFTAVGLDLVGEPGTAVRGRLELCGPDGTVLADQVVERGIVRWDRFAHFVELPDALDAGEHLLRVQAVVGRLGWSTLSEPAPAGVDDGVSPLPVMGRAVRDGVGEPGVRAIGVETIPAPNPVFRTSFEVPGEVREAELSAVGLGYGEFRLNGRAVTGDVLEPAQTTYDRTVLYRTYDVTALLRPGLNTLTAETGRGFYAARGANTWGWNFARWHREPVVLAQLEYVDGAGERHVVASGPDWEAAEGAVTSDLLYVGETTDPARARGAEWEPVLVVAPPGGELKPATAPPVRRTELLAPVSSTPLADGSVVHDFGEVLAGRIRLTAVGEAGAEIVVRYAEQLDEDGAVHCRNPLAAGGTQVDRFVLPDSGTEATWEPRFSYKGFRYAQVLGRAAVTEVRAVRLRTPVARVGEFECADDVLTWIADATARTFRNNLHGVPTDTPVYEKNGWTADAHLATEAVLHHVDLRESFGKWLDDHVDARDESGVVPQIVPSPGWGRAADPAWSASVVLIPWYLYQEYGDPAVLERYAEPIRTYTDRLLDLAPDGLWPHHSWGDWLSPGHHFAPEGPMPTATMMLRHVASRCADILDVLGETGAAERYRAAADVVATAYHQRFFDSGSGTYRVPGVGYRQAVNVLPLAFDAVPAEHVAAVAEGLFADIEHRTGGHLDCGAVAAKHLLPVLAAHGRPDLAITVATRRERPGWGVWREAGAATLMESWDETARSHNHYFLGAAAAWIQQAVGGLRPTSPGWASFDVAPILDDRVEWARTAHTTSRGRAAVEWRRSDGTWELEVEVPEAARAAVRLPGHPETSLPGGRHALRLPVATTRPGGDHQPPEAPKAQTPP
ncbi:alpha-L-rhamnosidase [Saccharopolyspora kobensis]|uniref:alpha-L-rhamnosidase n=1 Tax=Saccharopolyspora kobensis TaxID=146035 RepID=A0A1H6DRX1_9PSEU|nr:family 78 glycoside hydrolase catalytic domain [Saccharopolyspora kobensis]SEG87824.1 alpha-L-rhamnosidase [Saccharopolyspora kobensis]SFE04831.1 alpha-L-rhamnosidase [Saccharopolyspora kobensis]